MADEIEPEPQQVPGGRPPPLWLPAGSVRALIALLIVVTTCGLIFMEVPIPDWFLLTFTGTIAGYYSMRTNAPKE